jgi:hypothetical protein
VACTSGCPTRDHENYADCLRSKSLRVAYCNSAGGWDATKQKKWDNELSAYRGAVAEGLEPNGTTMRDIDAAKRKADTIQAAT